MIVIVSEVAFSFSWLKAATTTFTFKTLLGAFSVIVKTGCETDGSFYSTSDNSRNVGRPVWVQSSPEQCGGGGLGRAVYILPQFHLLV